MSRENIIRQISGYRIDNVNLEIEIILNSAKFNSSEIVQFISIYEDDPNIFSPYLINPNLKEYLEVTFEISLDNESLEYFLESYSVN